MIGARRNYLRELVFASFDRRGNGPLYYLHSVEEIKKRLRLRKKER